MNECARRVFILARLIYLLFRQFEKQQWKFRFVDANHWTATLAAIRLGNKICNVREPKANRFGRVWPSRFCLPGITSSAPFPAAV